MKRRCRPADTISSSRHLLCAVSFTRTKHYLACILMLFGAQTFAASCTSAHLAPGYCDPNGNMVADPPGDKSKWLDPAEIILADVPTTDTARRGEQLAPFLRHLEKSVGRKVLFFAARDYADLLAAFKEHRIHVLQLNTGSVELAVRCNGFVPIAQPVDATGKIDGYHMELLVPAKSTLKTARDLRGHRIAFVDEASASGYQVPKNILAHEFGLIAEKDYSIEFSGRQDSSIIGVANGLYEAAPAADRAKARLIKEGLVNPTALRVIYTSQVLPRSPWGVSHRINPGLLEKIRSAFVSYTAPNAELSNVGRLKAANYKTDWAFMRELSATSGQPPVCR